MKKIITVLLAAALCISFAACKKNIEDENETTAESIMTTTEATTYAKPEESTTKQPEENSQKGNELKSVVISTLGDNDLSGDIFYGKFTYKNNRDTKLVYANERTEELENKASANANDFVEKIKGFYGGEIKLDTFNAKEISFGENGIDSVRYEFYYINTQNQILTIYADSDAVISYADCEFTW